MSKDTADGGDVDAAEQFDIDLAVMAGELAKMLDDLGEALGAKFSVRRMPRPSARHRHWEPPWARRRAGQARRCRTPPRQ